MLDVFLIILFVAFIFSIVMVKSGDAKFFLCTVEAFFILILLIEVITGYAEIKEDKNYESLIAGYNEEIEDYQEELDEMIEVKSKINNYDYSKLLNKMDYIELIEKLLPELLEPVNGYTTPAVTALNEIELNDGRIDESEWIHQNINTIRWWYNFSNQ